MLGLLQSLEARVYVRIYVSLARFSKLQGSVTLTLAQSFHNAKLEGIAQRLRQLGHIFPPPNQDGPLSSMQTLFSRKYIAYDHMPE